MLFLKICGMVIVGAITLTIVFFALYIIAEIIRVRGTTKGVFYIDAFVNGEWVFWGQCTDVKNLATACFNLGKREDITKIHVRVAIK